MNWYTDGVDVRKYIGTYVYDPWTYANGINDPNVPSAYTVNCASCYPVVVAPNGPDRPYIVHLPVIAYTGYRRSSIAEIKLTVPISLILGRVPIDTGGIGALGRAGAVALSLSRRVGVSMRFFVNYGTLSTPRLLGRGLRLLVHVLSTRLNLMI